ncbi:MAG: hypothetical protein FWD68_04325, partial [Alphaproteobacteria bacterium]|nr:hypothetical protein [Alphaproteobacteria bacterium]
VSKELSGRIDNVSKELSGRIDNVSKELSGRIDNVSKELSGKIEISSKELAAEIREQGKELSVANKIIFMTKGGAIVLAVAIPIIVGLFWGVLGQRITDVLGIGAHKAPIEQSTGEKTAPH